jgi:hypothetical protein
MSINYAPKQLSTDLQDAIAQFLATKAVTRPTESKVAVRKAEKREAARKAWLDKRELEHTKLVDLRG